MILEPQAKSDDEIPKTNGCVCAVCGHENGYQRKLLSKLTARKYGADYVLSVAFSCEVCGAETSFRMKTKVDPSEFIDSINLYVLADGSRLSDDPGADQA